LFSNGGQEPLCNSNLSVVIVGRVYRGVLTLLGQQQMK